MREKKRVVVGFSGRGRCYHDAPCGNPNPTSSDPHLAESYGLCFSLYHSR